MGRDVLAHGSQEQPDEAADRPLLRQRPNGHGAYEALKERGLRIPEDFAVVGFDNQEIISDQPSPP